MLLDDIKTLIQTKVKDPIMIGSLLDENCVGLFQTGGQPPTLYFDNTMLERQGLQVVSRNKSYINALDTIKTVYKTLNKEVGFNPQQSPMFLGRNENGYAEFSVNYIIYIEE